MFTAVILCSGSGTRLNLGYNKVLHKINDKMICEYAIDKFKEFACEIIVVCNEKEVLEFSHISGIKLVTGGNRRQDSVYNGIMEASYDTVLIHDGARANVTTKIITEVLKASSNSDAVVCCIKVKDSIKRLNDTGLINVDRSNLYIAQTPQAVNKAHFLNLYNSEIVYTDDVSVIEKDGTAITLVLGDECNFKITTREDLEYFKYLEGIKCKEEN